MEARMPSPVMLLPGVYEALTNLAACATAEGLDETTIHLVHLRASQINSCAVCCDMHARAAKKAGESDARLFTVAAWRDAPYFTDAERAALALTEALTRLADRSDAVTDELFNEAARHFDQPALAALIVQIAQINVLNRLNAATAQVSGEWTGQFS